MSESTQPAPVEAPKGRLDLSTIPTGDRLELLTDNAHYFLDHLNEGWFLGTEGKLPQPVKVSGNHLVEGAVAVLRTDDAMISTAIIKLVVWKKSYHG